VPDIFRAPSRIPLQKTAVVGNQTVSPLIESKIDSNTVKLPTFLEEKRKVHPLRMAFSSYHYLPSGIRFETQEEFESIVLLLRQHWFTNVSWITVAIMLILIPVIFFPFLLQSVIFPDFISPSFILVFILSWYLFTLSYILLNFLRWYFNVWIVTNERLIDIEFVNLLSKKFAETRISKIEDVTMHTGGFIRSVFEFGDVIAQTAGTISMFQISAIPHPEQVVKIINNLMDKLERTKSK
jgi:hypothetical protein